MTKSLHLKEYKNMLKRLKEARLEASLTQVEVAKKLRKPQSYISKIENGERRIDVIELASVAKLYKKDINFFLK